MKITLALSSAFALVLMGCASSPSVSPQTSTTKTEVCKPTQEADVAALFDRWNNSLQSNDPHQVAANYDASSILLPTLSNKPRLSRAEKEDYFEHFLEKKPSGKIDSRVISIGCNTAVDSGIYTFTFKTTGAKVQARYSYVYHWNGKQWLIISHHSSGMPEKH